MCKRLGTNEMQLIIDKNFLFGGTAKPKLKYKRQTFARRIVPTFTLFCILQA